MSKSLPTRAELRCAGISMILAQILFMISWSLHLVDYDYYSVQNEDEVTKLHEILSSNAHRTEIEIGVACLWFSFPLLLMMLNGFQKFAHFLLENTIGEMFVYLFEKAFIIYICVSIIIIPAVSLVSVSFDWSFHESTVGDIVPTGYYIQLYVIIFQMELIDCLAVADAVFMVAAFLAVRVMLHNSHSKKLKKFREISVPELYKKIKKCAEIIVSFFVISLFVMFLVVLFEFAKSGFFSPTGYVKFLLIWSFLLKIYMGIRIVMVTQKSKWNKILMVFIVPSHSHSLDDTDTMIDISNVTMIQME